MMFSFAEAGFMSWYESDPGSTNGSGVKKEIFSYDDDVCGTIAAGMVMIMKSRLDELKLLNPLAKTLQMFGPSRYFSQHVDGMIERFQAVFKEGLFETAILKCLPCQIQNQWLEAKKYPEFKFDFVHKAMLGFRLGNYHLDSEYVDAEEIDYSDFAERVLDGEDTAVNVRYASDKQRERIEREHVQRGRTYVAEGDVIRLTTPANPFECIESFPADYRKIQYAVPVLCKQQQEQVPEDGCNQPTYKAKNGRTEAGRLFYNLFGGNMESKECIDMMNGANDVLKLNLSKTGYGRALASLPTTKEFDVEDAIDTVAKELEQVDKVKEIADKENGYETLRNFAAVRLAFSKGQYRAGTRHGTLIKVAAAPPRK
jgi:hypothetical protein